MTFLSARWTHLVLANYAVDPALLRPHLPRGTEPDLLGGRAFVSLVAFHFLDTRVLGVRWPGFVDFTEVNLRLYVRCGGLRGVAFVREFVPQRLVAATARATYNEPYRAVPMRGSLRRRGLILRVAHQLEFPFGTQRIAVEADPSPRMPPPGGEADWFKEHRWGFGTDHFGRTIRYEVRHPRWAVHDVKSLHLKWDWARVYGAKWGVLQDARPHSVLLAAGSRVKVRVMGGV